MQAFFLAFIPHIVIDPSPPEPTSPRPFNSWRWAWMNGARSHTVFADVVVGGLRLPRLRAKFARHAGGLCPIGWKAMAPSGILLAGLFE